MGVFFHKYQQNSFTAGRYGWLFLKSDCSQSFASVSLKHLLKNEMLDPVMGFKFGL